MREKIIAFTFAAVMMLFFAMNFAPRRDFSDTENRYLADMPKFSLEELFFGEFTEDFEEHIQDQFYARDFWVQLKNESELILQKSDAKGTYFAQGGGYIEKKDIANTELLEKNIDRLNVFYTELQALGIDTHFLAIPSAGTVYPERLPAYAPYPDELLMMDMIESALNFSVTNGAEALAPYSAEKLFFDTDHHWTQRGAYYAYASLMQDMGKDPVPMEHYDKLLLQDFYGSLYSKAPLIREDAEEVEYFVNEELTPTVYYVDTDETDDSFYTEENFTVKDKYTMFLGGNFSEVRVENPDAEKGNLLIVKDSFSHPLVPFLSEHYENVYVIDLRYYQLPLLEYIEANEIDDVLFSFNVSWFAEDANIAKLR